MLFVYLLHPQRGSMMFTLVFDKVIQQYNPRYIVSGLDAETLDWINSGLSNITDELVQGYEKDFSLEPMGESYGYIVVNRLYVKNEKGIRPGGDFHIFYEGWETYGECIWNPANGVARIQGFEMTADIHALIKSVVDKMEMPSYKK